MRRLSRFTLLATVFSLAIAFASSALAAPTPWQEIDVSLRPDASTGMMLVSGTLPDAAKLPAQAELAVPAGSSIQWIGEILGGDASADPELQYIKSTANGLDLYRFTLTKSRIAQIEIPTPTGAAFDGTKYASSLKWSASQDVPEVRMNVRIPKGAQIEQAVSDAAVLPGESTSLSYYSKTFKSVKAGDQLDLSFAYTVPAASAALKTAASTSSSSDTIVIVIILAVFIGGFGLLVYNVRRKMTVRTAAGEKTAGARVQTPARSKSSQPKSGSGHLNKPEVEPRQSRKLSPVLVIVAVIGALIIGVLFTANRSTTARAVDGKITKSFGAASPCTSASIPVMANQGVDLASQGGKLVDAFTGLEGVGDVTLDIARSTVDVKFCESKQSEDTMRQALSGTGLVTLGAPQAATAPATASLDSSGKKQTASVDTANGAFNPTKVVLKAGVPADLAFGQASGCVTEVIFSELGVKQDLTAGPATVSLPAMEAGIYAFACPMGHQTGELIVQ